MSEDVAKRAHRLAQVAAKTCVVPADARLLVVNDLLAYEMWHAQGMDATLWSRFASGASFEASAWPPSGPFDAAVVRLPRGREVQEMTFHAVISTLVPHGTMWVYGANDEGIKSVPKKLKGILGNAHTMTYKDHCRVLRAVRPEGWDESRASLVSWANQTTMWGAPWVTYPGVFAKGKLDEATAALLAHLPELPDGVRVLDFACGAGVIAQAVRVQQPDARISMCDADALALKSASVNVPSARPFLGDGWLACADMLSSEDRFDVILSNPPVHVGVTRDYTVLRDLIMHAASFLDAKKGGEVRFVVQRQAPVKHLLEEVCASHSVVWGDSRFCIWSGFFKGVLSA